jgi:hypothetical protein
LFHLLEVLFHIFLSIVLFARLRLVGLRGLLLGVLFITA